MCKKIIIPVLFFAFCAVFVPAKGFAQGAEAFNSSGLPIPRFVSLRSDKVFMRTGPALRYPIKWIYVQAGMPIEVVQEFDTWRKVRDIAGDEGWIHQSLLSGRRNVIVKEEGSVTLYRKAELTAKPVARLEKNVQGVIEQCLATWCEIEAGGFSGWVEKKSLYGVYASEELD